MGKVNLDQILKEEAYEFHAPAKTQIKVQAGLVRFTQDKMGCPVPIRSCPSGKIDYRSKKKALQGAAEILRDSQHVLYPYRCPLCHGVHLTKLPQR